MNSSYPVFVTLHFFKQLKNLKKKFPNIKNDLISSLKIFNPEQEICIGRSIYKIRIKSSDMNKGKSGGFRSYIYLFKKKDFLVPLCIYAKNQKENITSNDLQYHLDKTLGELFTRLK